MIHGIEKVHRARELSAQGHSHKSIAEQLNVPINTVWNWLCRKKRMTVTEHQKTLISLLQSDPGVLIDILKGNEQGLAEALVQDLSSYETTRHGSSFLIKLLREHCGID